MNEHKSSRSKWVAGSVIIAVVLIAVVTSFGSKNLDNAGGAKTVSRTIPQDDTPTFEPEVPVDLPNFPVTAGQSPPTGVSGVEGPAEGRRTAAIAPPLTGQRWSGVRTTLKGPTGNVALVVTQGDGRELKGRIVSVPEASGASFAFEGELVGKAINFSQWPQLNGGKSPKGTLTSAGLLIEVHQENGGVARFEFVHP